jgi:branched-subunit amino acid aminotransferase/4-amino-4-deoxychorismate lyase
MAWVYLDGAYLPAEQARIAAGDAGLLYGRGLFETFRARRHSVYRLDRHYERLSAGARNLDIPLALTLSELQNVVRELSERCELDDARLRLTLTAGSEGGRPSLFVQARPASDYPEELYRRGLTALIASARRNETSPLSGIKTLNCLDNVLAREEARRSGADEALLLNTRGLLAEGSATNVFLVRAGALLTPPVEDGALPGVTRGVVLELASGAGLVSRETSLTLEELREADEALLTNAILGVAPLVRVGRQPIGDGQPGPNTRHLRELYEAAVRC